MIRKKRSLQRFYKKSILPSILLLLAFIGICIGMFTVFVVSFEGYLLNSKISDFHDQAEQMGQMLATYKQEGDLVEDVSFLKDYLNEDSDLCVTDAKNHILRQFGDSVPDFEHAENMGDMEEYLIIPDIDPNNPEQDRTLNISYREFLNRCLETLPNAEERKDGRWMEKNIIDSHFWIEVPVHAEGYRLYYKDSITLSVKNTYYIVRAIFMNVSMLMIPFVLLFFNVLSSIVTQHRMVNLLYLDAITGGKNWMYFIQQSLKILCRFRTAGHGYAIVNLHMNRYQDYCACYGSREGEKLLKSINAFLQVNVGKQEAFARFETADFGLLLRCDSLEQCEKRLKKLLAELTGIQHDRLLSYQAGMYLIPSIKDQTSTGNGLRRRSKKQLDVNQMYHYANVARESLGERSRGYIKIFDDLILQEQLWKRKVEDTMETALLNREFHLYLQPKYNPVSQKIVGAEALVRWISPTDGMIPTERFIPIFEESGFITKLDDYMIAAAAKLQSERKIQGRKLIPISVNVSRANFTRENLAQHICQLVDSYGTDHAMLELEVTESAFFGEKNILKDVLQELKNYGFRISMDDFGAGYSSLNSLKDLPIDVLKLDMDFFKGEDQEKRGEIIVKESIRLAKNLNMEIVAEGIEKEEQVQFLADEGCDMIQGFYFAKAMTVREFDERMEQDG